MDSYGSFQEMAAGTCALTGGSMSVFNHSMTGEKFRRIATTSPTQLSQEDLMFAVEDTKEDYEADQRRGESSSGGRLHQWLQKELSRRGGNSDNPQQPTAQGTVSPPGTGTGQFG